MEEARRAAYNGPKARIAIADFEDKTSSSGLYRAEFGRGLADMLSTSLFQSNHFIVLDRQDLGSVLAEQDFAASGRVDPRASIQRGGMEGAELLVQAAVTGFEPDAGGLSGGLGGLLGKGLGGLTGSAKKARVAMDLKVIETKTGRIVAATSVAGEAKSFGLGVAGAGSSMGGGLGMYAKSPMEAALRNMIQTAVEFLCDRTPPRYFHDEPEVAAATLNAGLGKDEIAAPAPLARQATLATIRSDKHEHVIVDLLEVKRRGAILTVAVRVRLEKEDSVNAGRHQLFHMEVTDYATGELYKSNSVQGGNGGWAADGEIIRFSVPLPPEVTSGSVYVHGLGSFQDVELAASRLQAQ